MEVEETTEIMADEVELVEVPDEEEEVEVIVVFRDEQRSINYHSLFSFLPMMPFHRALVHNTWDQLF